MRRPSSKSLLLVLLLASAAALVAVGILSMGSALRVAEDRARSEARRAASVRADAMRRVFSDAAVLEHCAEERFDIVEGRPRFAWVPPELPMAPGSKTFVELRLLDIQRKEFVERDPAAARALLQKSEAESGLAPTAQGAFLLRRAWLERREGIADDASVTLDELMASSICDADFASAAWLAVCLLIDGKQPSDEPRSDEPQSDDKLDALRAWLGRTVHLNAQSLEDLEMLASDAMPSLLPALLKAARAQQARQAALESCTWLAEAREANARFESDRLIFVLPDARGGMHGAILTRGRLSEVMAAVQPESEVRVDDSELVPTSRDGELRDPTSLVEVWPGLSLRVGEASTPERWTGSRMQPLLLGAIALLFSLLLWAYLRSLRAEREALALRSDFLRSVSHELRTPLTSIRMLAETLETGRVASEAKRSEYHALMAGEAARLGALVENVLDLGRIERGERQYVLEPMRLDRAVTQCAELLAPLARRAELDLRVRVDATLVLGERDALQQAILNLLDNACKYAASGAFVEMSIRRDGAFAVLRVLDDGPGVRSTEAEAIFERFRRGAKQKSGAIPGAGIGLAIARSIAESHGGRLELVDVPKGACFELWIPRALPEDDALQRDEPSNGKRT